MRHHVKMATINSWTVTSVVKDVKKSEPSYDAFKNVNGADTLENSLAVPQKKINHELLFDSAILLQERWKFVST